MALDFTANLTSVHRLDTPSVYRLTLKAFHTSGVEAPQHHYYCRYHTCLGRDVHPPSSRRCSGQCTPRPEENGAGARTSVTATGSGARAGFVSCRAGGSRLPGGGSEKGREKDAQHTGREAEGAERGSTTNCEGCGRAAGDVRVDQELLDGFGVSVCRDCKVGRVTFMPGPSILRYSDILLEIQHYGTQCQWRHGGVRPSNRFM